MPAPISPHGPSRLLIAVAVGALCTAGASAGAATLLTRSANPSAWIETYRLSTECHQSAAARDPRCSADAAQAAAELRLAASLESRAKALAAQQGTAPDTGTSSQPAAPAGPDTGPAAAPPAHAAPSGDDSQEGHDD